MCVWVENSDNLSLADEWRMLAYCQYDSFNNRLQFGSFTFSSCQSNNTSCRRRHVLLLLACKFALHVCKVRKCLLAARQTFSTAVYIDAAFSKAVSSSDVQSAQMCTCDVRGENRERRRKPEEEECCQKLTVRGARERNKSSSFWVIGLTRESCPKTMQKRGESQDPVLNA